MARNVVGMIWEDKDKPEAQTGLLLAKVDPVTPSLTPAAWKRAIDGGLNLFLSFLNLIQKRDPNVTTKGNWIPVPEIASIATGLKITGELPACLNGEFARTGPNPKYAPSLNCHLFDGDGMIHAVRIKDGQASYINRYVRTSRLMHEELYGQPMFVKFGDMKGLLGLLRILVQSLRGCLGILDLSKGTGTANTALVYHNGVLMALHEGDAPYVVRVLADGQLETLGRFTYGGSLGSSMAAHPKVDAVTGELFSHSYGFEPPSFLKYRVVSPEGQLGPTVPITIPGGVMMHDIGLTERFVVFPDLPLEFRPEAMIKKGTIPFQWMDRPARFGVMPRYDATEANIRWFELPPMFFFHIGNVWEEADEVVLVAPCFSWMSIDFDDPKEFPLSALFEHRFNLSTGRATSKQLATFPCDFPRIDDRLVGRKARYVYAAVVTEAQDFSGIVKVDVTAEPQLAGLAPFDPVEVGGCVAGIFRVGEGRTNSEAVFVPKSGPIEGPQAVVAAGDGDDGYLLTWVYDTTTRLSEMLVIDAKTMSPDPVATVHLGVRVPDGFHGTFVTEEQIQRQRFV